MAEDPILVLLDPDPNATTALALALRALEPSWRILVARTSAQALEILALGRVLTLVSDGALPTCELQALSREILIHHPEIVHVQLHGVQSELRPSSRWSERHLAKPCPAECLLHEIRIAHARSQADSRQRPASLVMTEACPTVLVIDHSREDVGLLQLAFRQMAFPLELHHVADGATALDFLQNLGRFDSAPTPNVILLDLNMPVMNGYEFLARYRSLPRPMVPVVVLSSVSRECESADAIRHGATAYVPKPTTWDRFLDLANNLGRFAHLSAHSQQSDQPRSPEQSTR